MYEVTYTCPSCGESHTRRLKYYEYMLLMEYGIVTAASEQLN